MNIRVVTDSTAYLPAEVAAAAQLSIVPLTVTVSGRDGREGLDVSTAEVARALGERRFAVTTSRPAPAEFVRAYQELFDAAATGIVSVHLSSKLSGTCESAELAQILVMGAPGGGRDRRRRRRPSTRRSRPSSTRGRSG